MPDLRKTFGKLTIPLLLLLTISFSASPAYAKYGGGTGEPNDPYLIYTAEQMNAIGANPHDWDKHFKLMADIDLRSFRGTAFNIIGYFVDWDSPANKPFTGVFDGNDHTISNFTYNSTGTGPIGLFACVSGENAEIKDLGLIAPDVDAGTGDYVGSLLGMNGGPSVVAAIIGGTITGCYVEGGSISAENSVGGLVGLSWGTITNCYAIGSVSGRWEVGGLVGGNYGTISNCYSSAGVSGMTDVGGLTGCNGAWETWFYAGTITNCYSEGDVSGDYGVGGLVGWNEATITNCYSAGSISGTGWDIGGLAGGNEGEVSGSFWDIETSGQTWSAGGTAKTTAEMQTMSTFADAGWGCEPAWTIDAANDYPRLSWENRPGEAIPTPSYGGGGGEPNDPYLIYTAEQLNTIGVAPCHWDKHFKLMADIDLSGFTGTEFNIIGYWVDWGSPDNKPFTGVFDGSGHTIFNFTYNASGLSYPDNYRIGLFRYVDDPNAEIKDLGLLDPDVDAGTGYYVGSLVGQLYRGTVTNCFAEEGSITGDYSVGGLAGSSSGTIANCYSSGDVSGVSEVGGLIGYNSGTITNSYATCSIVGETYYIGGLVGNNHGAITNCYSNSNVTGDWSVGGLVGSGGTIINCYAVASVSGANYVGGLVGYNSWGTITNSYAEGVVSGTTDVGGLVGENYFGTINNCYSSGSVTGDDRVGGMVGYNYYATIANCYSTGSVSGDGNVGGLVGAHIYGNISASFWDIETSGQATSAGGVGKTTAEMQTQSTFTDAGWDFVGETVNGTDDIWTIHDGQDYPKLVWKLVNFIGWYEVDFADFAFFANHWAQVNCSDSSDCDGADLDFSDAVDGDDLKIFCNYWLAGK